MRLRRVEQVAGEDPAHRISPADRAGEADGGTSEGQDAAGDLDLPEPGRRCGNRDVAREHEFDSQGEAGALHRYDDGLAELLSGDLPRVDAAVWHGVQAVWPDSRGDVGEIKPTGEVVAVGEDESGPQLRIALELTVGEGEFLQKREVGGIALVRSIESDEEHVAVAFDGDSGRGFGNSVRQGWPFECWLVCQCYCAGLIA